MRQSSNQFIEGIHQFWCLLANNLAQTCGLLLGNAALGHHGRDLGNVIAAHCQIFDDIERIFARAHALNDLNALSARHAQIDITKARIAKFLISLIDVRQHHDLLIMCQIGFIGPLILSLECSLILLLLIERNNALAGNRTLHHAKYVFWRGYGGLARTALLQIAGLNQLLAHLIRAQAVFIDNAWIP